MRAAMLSAVVLCSVSSSSCSVYCGDRGFDRIVGADEEKTSLRSNATKTASRCQKAKTQSATSQKRGSYFQDKDEAKWKESGKLRERRELHVCMYAKRNPMKRSVVKFQSRESVFQKVSCERKKPCERTGKEVLTITSGSESEESYFNALF